MRCVLRKPRPLLVMAVIVSCMYILRELFGFPFVYDISDDADMQVVAIGGTGGSGTRAVCLLFILLGYWMGDELNNSRDFVAFAFPPQAEEAMKRIYTHKRSLVYSWDDIASTDADKLIVENAMTPAIREFKLACRNLMIKNGRALCGFKMPQSMLHFAFFHASFPNMKFVHVVRDGRDMAISNNRRQVSRWSDAVLGRHYPLGTDETTDKRKMNIEFWSRTNVDFALNAHQLLHKSMLFVLTIESLVFNTVHTIEQLAAFVQIQLDDDTREKVTSRLNLGIGWFPNSTRYDLREDMIYDKSMHYGKWRRLIRDALQLSEIEQAGAKGLKMFGYV